MDWISSLLGFTCRYCNQPVTMGKQVCFSCADRITLLERATPLQITVQDLPVIALFHYEKWKRDFVLNLKLKPSPSTLNRFARALIEALPKEWSKIPVIWIPGHSHRKPHLVEVLAFAMKRQGMLIAPPVFLRRRFYAAQAQHTLAARDRTNRKTSAVYQVNPWISSRYSGQMILLDDVITTGSTMLGCKKLIEDIYPQKIEVIGGLALAHTPKSQFV
jgi:predicted amidophosphoribosyltransferase